MTKKERNERLTKFGFTKEQIKKLDEFVKKRKKYTVDELVDKIIGK